MTTITKKIATTPIVYASEGERTCWEEEMARREAMDEAFLFRRMVREGNAGAVTAMMEEGRSRLRRAIQKYEDPTHLLRLAYEKMGEEHGLAVCVYITKRYSWNRMGSLVSELVWGDAPKSLRDEVIVRYRSLYVSYEEWDAIPCDEDVPYPPTEMWKEAKKAALARLPAMMDCFLSLAVIGIKGAVASGAGWEYAPLRECDAVAMPMALRQCLTIFHEKHIGR